MLLSLVLMICFQQTTKADHTMAVDLTYKCINETTYELTLGFYLDCSSGLLQDPPEQPIINIISNTCGEAFNTTLTQEDSGLPTNEVSPFCAEELLAGNTTCLLGDLPGVKRFIYKGEVTIPKKCSDWVFSYQLEGGANAETRSALITNLINPEFESLYVEATLNNTFACNSSPNFLQMPVGYFCNVPSSFSLGVDNPEADSTVFSLMQPLSGPNNPITYSNINFTPEQPFNVDFFTINSDNGNISFEPNGGDQVAVVAMKVEEYRNGVLIGSVMRDMQFLVLDCTNQQLSTTVSPSQIFYNVCPDETLTFEVTVTDPDVNDEIDFRLDVGNIEGALFTIPPGETNPVTGTFSWTPTIDDAGFYTVRLIVSDQACPLSSFSSHVFYISVWGNPNAGNDLVYCELGDNLIVNVGNGLDFTWTPTTDLTFLNGNGSQVEIAPSGNVGSSTTYTITNHCGLTDELTVEIAENIGLEIIGGTTACEDQGIVLSADVTGNLNDFSFTWSPIEGGNDPNSSSIFVQPRETTIYELTATSLVTGCAMTVDHMVEVGSIGAVDITAVDDSLCIGESTQVTAKMLSTAEVFCGSNGTLCDRAGEIVEIGIGEGETLATTPYNAFFRNNRLQILYTREDLLAMGATSGTITSIAFNVAFHFSEGDEPTYENLTIKMGCLNVTQLNDFLPGLQQVYQQDFVPDSLWNTHILDTPYDWDGVSNLVIEVCYSNAVDGLIFDRIAYTTASYDAVATAFSSSVANDGCTLTNPTISRERPDIQLGICQPASTNTATVTWTPTTGLSDSTIANPIITPTATTTYKVSFDDKGCISEGEITIVVPSENDIVIQSDTILCQPATISLPITGNIPTSATYQWTPTTGLSSDTIAEPMIEVTDDITYTLAITFNDGCGTVLEKEINISIQGDLKLDITNDRIAQAREVIDLAVTGDFSAVIWTPEAGLNDPTSATPTATVNETTTYTAIATSEFGCVDSASVTLTVLASCEEVLMPTAFSPNEDGNNDMFGPSPVCLDSLLSFRVFNRWGVQVFEANEVIQKWDGYYQSRQQPIGSYVYHVKAILNGEEVEQRGWVVLLR